MLQKQINEEVKEAMRAKDEIRLSVVRGLIAAFTNELIAKRRKPSETLTDEEALAVIRRQAKQREDSIAQFRAGEREDLAAKEEAELRILQTYLPALLPRDEIKRIALARQQELGIIDRAQAGQLMSVLMKELKGRADGAEVKFVVDELLNQ